MIARLFDIFFGCWHRSYTFPITTEVLRGAWRSKQTYVVCLDCGTEFHYDLRTMRTGARRTGSVTHTDKVFEARRADDEQHIAGRAAQEPLNQSVITLIQKGHERKKA